VSTAGYLTKSRYTAGLQCRRRLWLNVHDAAEWSEPELGSAECIGLDIARMARRLFPGGVLVDEQPGEHAEAVAHTASLMADPSVPAIFEAAFEHAGVRIRVDVLERHPRGYWGMCEVKSSGEVKDHHYDEVAILVHVLRGVGVRLSSVEVFHTNRDYVRGRQEISWPKFFRRVNAKAKVKHRLDGIETRLRKQRACLSQVRAPRVEPEAHCHTPVSCEHWERCTKSKPADWVFYMPNLSSSRRAELKAAGIESIAAIPDDFGLSPRQAIVREVVRNARPFVASDLSKRLQGSGPPAFYLDFEAFLPAVPLYPGTRPYEVIPFQWSLHLMDRGKLRHQEFLADAGSDPRRRFAETLIAALCRSELPIIVYSSYERTRLEELAALYRGLAKPIRSIVSRLFDLLPIVRSGVYHPGFNFSNSIKTAAPALCPDVTYEDLEEVTDGEAASTAFWLMASGQVDGKTAARLRRRLRAYCERDTLAMVRLHQALSKLAAQTR
jgi:predicted RecB family nuclease